ncbi:RNA polymerase III RPC4 [Forsythia ovata]|uniref:RNA polymerase III RPC4 n=1 Tax=Forsythia ovata TaxID=205694 RepID=A0ABD1SM45_9LAMI
MDSESLAASKANAPRKVKFAPKAPPKKEQKPVLPKVEKIENDIDAARAQDLLRRFNESSMKAKPKFERKVGNTQIAFGYGGSSTTLKSYGAANRINKKPGSSSDGGGVEQRVEKEYKEPWNYYSYYPLQLPLRRPYSGNPELLDKEEFEDDSTRSIDDEYATNPALKLGLMEENLEDSMFFVQLPTAMPMTKPCNNAEGREQGSNTNPVKGARPSQKPCGMEALPAGFMGKMLVYRSGAVKLKLGDTLYDVSAGLDCVFAHDVVALNTEEKHCCSVGELNKRVVITPDVDSILDSMSDL